MPRREQKSNEEGAFQRVTGAVKRLFGRGRSSETSSTEPAPTRMRPKAEEVTARPVRRETDIPMDVLSRSYTPPMTSSKAGFRADGVDHARDQEFALGSSDERFNDEDHFTNKSGDSRIGTHRRTYEPVEDRIESRD
jgi:hypothetical protein